MLKVRNVYVFPGVPRLLHQKFNAIASVFEGSPYFCGSITLSLRETEFCEALDAIVAVHDSVSIGSYPRMENGAWVSRLTIDGFDSEHVHAAYATLLTAFSTHVIETEAIRRSTESSSS